ncbi:MAG: fimbrial protein [Leclercia sp.]
MKHHMTLFAFCTGLFSSVACADIVGTSSLNATFTTTIVPGTCTATVKNAEGIEATDINFGSVFRSELINKSRTQAFSVDLSNCSGVAYALITAIPGAGGACSTAGSDNFGASNNVAFEIWQDATDTGTKLSCTTQPKINIKTTAGDSRLSMNARIVIADAKTINDVTTGPVTAPVTFTVTYQ